MGPYISQSPTLVAAPLVQTKEQVGAGAGEQFLEVTAEARDFAKATEKPLEAPKLVYFILTASCLGGRKRLPTGLGHLCFAAKQMSLHSGPAHCYLCALSHSDDRAVPRS